jgi:hypothetical protein
VNPMLRFRSLSDCRYSLMGVLGAAVLLYTLFVLDQERGYVTVLRGNKKSGLAPASPAFCNQNTTFSQFAQDAYIAHNVFPGKRDGVYVELGAYHPTRLSNTALFDLCYGWKGMCIDMNPFHKAEFEAQRTCEFVHTCVGNRSWADYYLQDNTLADGKEGVSRVFCEPFAAVLKRSHIVRRHIDLLSIDIEGNEMDALHSFPFDSVHVEAVLVETWRVGKEAVFDFLEDRGFIHKAELGPDDLFVWDGKGVPWLPPQTAEWRAAVRAQRELETREGYP